ncbi:MAG: zinc-binding alcohol dehydrogenase family protein [Rhizobacter sp.]|nr:zinc-binding alcohol dehydrogenase family protein [Rhizobacter sp.]
MKAVVFERIGAPLRVGEVPAPAQGQGDVIVDVAAARVLPYAGEVFDGRRTYPLDLPAVPGPGAIGRVRSIGLDATRLQPGDWVYCDPTIRARDHALAPDTMLQGLIAPGPGPRRLQAWVGDGSWAEQVRVPTENLTPIGQIEPHEARRWCALGTLLVPLGGLLAAELRAGETLLLHGATGSFGSAGVAVALALGAGCVVAPGRNRAALDDLVRRFGARVRTLVLSGDAAADQAAMQAAAPGPIDCVLDLMPPSAPASAVRAAVMTVRPGGRVVLMGGVGMEGGDELALPYPWLMRNGVTVRGQWMYPRSAPQQLVALVRAGLLDLGHFTLTAFALERVADAVTHAAAHAGPFRMTVLHP